MIDMKHRSTERELMDDPTLSKGELFAALEDISKVNKWLGGNSITVKAVQKLINEYPNKTTWTIADVGCGDGEMLRILADTLKNTTIRCTGIDISIIGLETARKQSKEYENISYRNENILETPTSKGYDIVISTLTLHHIPEKEIIPFIEGIIHRAQYGVIINDLERSKIAYGLFKLFSRIFIQSPVAKNDGLVSIASAFRKSELEKYAQALGLKRYRITWKWAFRYLWYIKII